LFEGFAPKVLKSGILHQKHQKGGSPRVSKGALERLKAKG
jgi:hypothetical protein